MFTIRSVLAGVLLTAMLPFSAVDAYAGKSAKVKVKYDKFKDTTTVESPSHKWPLGRLALNGGGAMSFEYTCPGQTTDCDPPGVTLTFTRRGIGWLMMHDEKSITFLVDGRRIAADNVTWDGTVGEDDVVEWFIGSLTVGDFRTIISGQDVEVRIGTGSFTRRFSAKELDDWREFGSAIGGNK